MNKYLKFSLASILLLLSGITIAGTFEEGLTSFEKKNYVAAKKLWQPLAKAGDARAQYNLALLLLKEKNKQQSLQARKYLAMSRSEGLIDGYFLIIPDTHSKVNSTKTVQQSISDPLQWLHQQNKRSYTLQLATGKVKEHMEKMRKDLLSRYQLKQAAQMHIHKVKTVEKQGTKEKASARYILVYGVFESYQQAKTEVSKLPPPMQKSSPWIRQFSVLQSIVDKEQL